MGWQDVLKICGAIIASFGGAGAVVLSLSGFLGKFWAERALQDDRQRYAQLNLQIENELRNASQRLQLELDKFGLVNKLRIEGEFQRLALLWKSFANLSFTLNGIVPSGFDIVPADKTAKEAFIEKRRQEFEISLHNTQQLFYEEMVFVPKSIADVAKTTLEKALQEPGFYVMFSQHHDPQIRAKYGEHTIKLLSDFMAGMKSLETAIRDHIQDVSKKN